MVPRPLARAQAMRSRTCADVIQPCHRSKKVLISYTCLTLSPLGGGRPGSKIKEESIRKLTDDLMRIKRSTNHNIQSEILSMP